MKMVKGADGNKNKNPMYILQDAAKSSVPTILEKGKVINIIYIYLKTMEDREYRVIL